MFKVIRQQQHAVKLSAAIWCIYLLAYLPIYHAVGLIATALGAIPVALSGWLLGRWAGVIAGLLLIPANIALTHLATGAGMDAVNAPGLLGYGVSLARPI